MYALLNLIDNLITLYLWILFASVIASWLISFDVLKVSNRAVYLIVDFLYRATEPALRPIRRFMPNLGAIDLSPVVLILALLFLRDFLFESLQR